MKKILVIEDDPLLLEILLKLLTAEGFYVQGVGEGYQGVELAKNFHPDLILCDLVIPGLDGYSVLKQLKQDTKTNLIPFICLTARNGRTDIRRIMELGGDDYLTKPFTKAELLGAISSQLQKKERIQQQSQQVLHDAIKQLNDQVYYDSLTNLPNRRILHHQFQQAINHQLQDRHFVPVSVLSIDRLEYYKQSLGIDYSNRLIQAVVERLTLAVGENGLVVRLNSEQIALILEPITQKSEINQQIEWLLNSLSQPLQILQYQIIVTACLGIAFYPEDEQDFDHLLTQANAALHVAKQQGNNRYILYTSEISAGIQDRWQLENDLRHALMHNELIIHYQPQLELQTDNRISAEALVRWQHPSLGLMSPSQFLPLAEETGLIVYLDEWVIQQVSQQARYWQTQGIQLSISVNVSALELTQRNLCRSILQILKNTGLDPNYLELELTESILVENPTQASHTLRELKALGIKLALDDFGTGYSSLSYLQQFPFDSLKIDRSFVHNVAMNPKNAAIVIATIQMAHGLGLQVVAEGVETEADKVFLQQHHCDRIQGFLFSRPVEAIALEQFLIDGKIEQYSPSLRVSETGD
ncbi:MAG: EAL domain-containing protein [Microcoleaceae cyanobacterium]